MEGLLPRQCGVHHKVCVRTAHRTCDDFLVCCGGVGLLALCHMRNKRVLVTTSGCLRTQSVCVARGIPGFNRNKAFPSIKRRATNSQLRDKLIFVSSVVIFYVWRRALTAFPLCGRLVCLRNDPCALLYTTYSLHQRDYIATFL